MNTINEPSKLKAEVTYNAAADHFDDGPLAFWDRYGRRTVERLSLSPGSLVLDVGCGSGASAIPAAIKVGPHGRVIGIDLAERLLDIARTKSIAQKLHNVDFRRADMEALSYPDNSFDAVVCVFAVFFVTDMVKQVRELWRVVRPGGKLAITTWGPRMFEPGSEAWWSAVKEFVPISSLESILGNASPPSRPFSSFCQIAESKMPTSRQRMDNKLFSHLKIGGPSCLVLGTAGPSNR